MKAVIFLLLHISSKFMVIEHEKVKNRSIVALEIQFFIGKYVVSFPFLAEIYFITKIPYVGNQFRGTYVLLITV